MQKDEIGKEEQHSGTKRRAEALRLRPINGQLHFYSADPEPRLWTLFRHPLLIPTVLSLPGVFIHLLNLIRVFS